MRGWRGLAAGGVVVTMVGCASGHDRAPAAAAGEARGGERGGFTVLSVNDTYRIEGLDGGTRGGLARLRALRAQLEARGESVLLLHAGDFLYPAFQSRKFHGAQMVDVLNLLDGDAEAFDERMFATFGNHEFDKAKLSDAPRLEQTIRQSQFYWLSTNLEWAQRDDGEPVVAAPNLKNGALFELGGVRIGIFSITLDEKQPAYIAQITAPEVAARRSAAELRRQGAEVVIGLTHLKLDRDKELLRTLGDDGPDIIFGGHEHEAHLAEVDGRWIFKADADAASAVVVRAGLSPAGDFEVRSHQVVELGPEGPAPDPRLAVRVREWLRAFDLVHCVVDLGLTASCLDERLGRTRVELVAEELEIRRFETNVGNLAADVMLDAYADRGAQVAFVNSGSLRLNQNLPEDSYVERRHLEELFAYPARLRLLRLDGRTLQQVLEHSVEAWTGSGWWLQVAGMTFRHDPDAGTVSELSLLTASGPRPIRRDEQIIAVTNEFLVDPDGGQDGYTMLHPGQTIDDGPGPDLKHLVAEALAAAGEQGIAPRIEGRICNTQREGLCLLSN